MSAGRLMMDLGPGIPRMDIEPLDLPKFRPLVISKGTIEEFLREPDPTPPAKPTPKAERCWLCNGSGEMLNDDRSPRVCGCCGGTGEIGGGR